MCLPYFCVAVKSLQNACMTVTMPVKHVFYYFPFPLYILFSLLLLYMFLFFPSLTSLSCSPLCVSPLSFLFFALSDMNQDSSDEEPEEEDFSRVQFGSRYTAAARCVLSACRVCVVPLTAHTKVKLLNNQLVLSIFTPPCPRAPF